MTPGDDQTTSAVWNSPLYMTNTIKWTSTVSSKLLPGRLSSNIERYNNLYEEGISNPMDPTPGSPVRVMTPPPATWNASATGTASTRIGTTRRRPPRRHGIAFSSASRIHWGPVKQGLANANADLYQNYQNGVPQTVTLYATPAWWRDRLNANLGIYGQDVWTMSRLTLTIGGRWDYVSEQVDGQPAQGGRFANIPAFGDIKMPTWKTFSPRAAVVYDLSGNGKTAVRFGFNRFEAAATTTLAELYDPASGNTITTTATWSDKNRDDIAQGSRGCNFLTDLACEINFATVPANFGVVSLASPDANLKRPYVDQMNLGVTHEILRGDVADRGWYHNIGRNWWERTNIARPGTYNGDGTVTNSGYRPITVFSPIDGSPITVYDTVSTALPPQP